jgi:protein-tyrosine-phosphatase
LLSISPSITRQSAYPPRGSSRPEIDEAQAADPNSPAVAVLLSDFNIDARAHHPRCVRYLALKNFQYVIAIDNPGCHEVANVLTANGVRPETLRRWAIADPWGSPNAYRACAQEVLGALAAFRAAEFVINL